MAVLTDSSPAVIDGSWRTNSSASSGGLVLKPMPVTIAPSVTRVQVERSHSGSDLAMPGFSGETNMRTDGLPSWLRW